MKAIQISETGGPDVLKYVELPTPRPGPDEVLIKAHAIGVCMPETLVRKGIYRWMPPLPVIPGIEMSGTAVEVGNSVKALRVGQPVFVSAREFKQRAGCYAEYIAAREQAIYALPEVRTSSRPPGCPTTRWRGSCSIPRCRASSTNPCWWSRRRAAWTWCSIPSAGRA